MMKVCKSGLGVTIGLLVVLGQSGCQQVGQLAQVGTAIGLATGSITQEEADSIQRSSDAVAKSYEDITPEQEYYIGRAVAASVLNRYQPYQNEAATRYVNLLGQSLAMASDKPETFGGYHFLILDSDEINAFACPGGLIFVTRGMLRLCSSEAELAAVLAHEIGHVENNSGLRAIKKSRLTSALTIIAAESAKQFGSEELAELTEEFEGSIQDITSSMMNSGYARNLETETDRSALRILRRVGYDPQALVSMLQAMDKTLKPGGLDFSKTHPDPADRIRAVQGSIGSGSSASVPEVRRKRFARSMQGV